MLSREIVEQMMNADVGWAAVLYLFQNHSNL